MRPPKIMAHHFTSIVYAWERLQEAEYFLGRMANASGTEFTFELNAFLSASRSVTFVLQKALTHVAHFEVWFAAEREQMKSDGAMRFFLELRNISQKQGPVAHIAGGTTQGGWSRRFVSVQTRVPSELVGREVTACCAEHLQKLALLILKYFREFPFHACVARALTPEGMDALNYTFEDVEALLGLPAGYTDVGGQGFSVAEKLKVLRREVDTIDVADLERLARGGFLADGNPIIFAKSSGHDLTDDIARLIDQDPTAPHDPRVLFLKAITKRISDLET
jgi:hypothetical protein